MKEKMIKNRIGVLALSLVMILCMMLSPMTAFADTSTIPMYLTVKEEPLVFDVTERITMEATQGTTDLSVTPVTVTNNGKKIQVSSIAINPASGWTVEANSTDFSTAGKKSLGFTCNSHDFSTGAYAPGDQIDTGSNLMYTLSGKVSAKADVMASTQVASMVVTVEKAVTLISFTIDESVAGGSSSVTYQAEQGMTWAQWVESSYNTGSYFVDGGNRIAINSNSAMYVFLVYNDSTFELPEYGIKSQTYTVKSTGGGSN